MSTWNRSNYLAMNPNTILPRMQLHPYQPTTHSHPKLVIDMRENNLQKFFPSLEE